MRGEGRNRPYLIAANWEPSWRGALDVLAAWCRDEYDMDSVAKAIARAPGERRPTLAAYDKWVRAEARKI